MTSLTDQKFKLVPATIHVFENTKDRREQNHSSQMGEFVTAEINLKVQPNGKSIEVWLKGIQSKLGSAADMEIMVEIELPVSEELIRALLLKAEPFTAGVDDSSLERGQIIPEF